MTQLNAVGRPYGPSYDPGYKMKYKPSYGHLRFPYGPSMRFVGDPPDAGEKRTRHREPKPAPLLAPLDVPAQQRRENVKALCGIERKLHALGAAFDRDIKRLYDTKTQVTALIEKIMGSMPSAPAPVDSQLNMMTASQFLGGIENLVHGLQQAMLKTAEEPQERKPERSTSANTILTNRIELDLIERLEGVRGVLETVDGGSRGLVLADDALRHVIDHLVQVREQRHRENGWG